MFSQWIKTIAIASTLLLIACNSEPNQAQATNDDINVASEATQSNSSWQVRQAAVIGDGDFNSATGQFLFGNGENFGADNWRFRIEAFHPAGIQNMYMVLGPSGGPYATHYLCANNDCGLNGGTSARGWVSGISPWNLEIAEGPGNYNADLYVVPVGGGQPVFVSGANFQWSPASLTISQSSSLSANSVTLLWNALSGPDVRYNISVREIEGGVIAYRTGVQGNFSVSGLNIPLTGHSSVQVSVEAVNSSGVIARAAPLVLEQAVEQEPIELEVTLASTYVNANSQSIIGTVTRNNAEVTVSFNGGESHPAEVSFFFWTLDTSVLNLDDGTYTVTITASDGVDNVETSGQVIIDRVVPVVSFDQEDYSFDLFDEVWTVSGNISEPSTLHLYIYDQDETFSHVYLIEEVESNWTIDARNVLISYPTLATGQYFLAGYAIDSAFNLSEPTIINVEFNNNPPDIFVDDTIVNSANETSVFIGGVLYSPESDLDFISVTLFDGDPDDEVLLGNAVVESGSWFLEVDFSAIALEDGNYPAALTIRAVSLYGITTMMTGNLLVDTISLAPTIELDEDTGSVAGVTSNGTFTVTGLEEGATVEYSIDGGTTWSTEVPNALEGENSISVRQTDNAGNVSNSSTLTFILDTTAADAPSISLNEDTGSVEGITSNGAFTVTGIEDGATVEYSTDGGNTWNTAVPTAVEGENTISVRQTDSAGNVSDSSTLAFTLDTIPPDTPSFDEQDYTFDLFDEAWDVSGAVTEETVISLTLKQDEVVAFVILAGFVDEEFWNGNLKPTFQNEDLPLGEYTLEVFATDFAGNISPTITVSVVITDGMQGPPPIDGFPVTESTQCIFMPAMLYADQANDLQWDLDPWNSVGESTLSLDGWSGALGASLTGTELSFSNPEPGIYSNLNLVVNNLDFTTQNIGPYSLEIKPNYNSGLLMTASPSTFGHELSRADALGRQWLIGDDPRFGATNSRFVMIRLTEDGFPDSSFGTAGRLEIDLRNFSSFPSDAVYPNNRIIPVTAEPIGTDWLIGGYVRHYDANSIVIGHSAFLLRVDQNGDPVTEFADYGLWYYEESGLHLEVGALLVNGPEEIFVALNELSWNGTQLSPDKIRVLHLNAWAETPDINLNVLFNLNLSLSMRVRVIAPVPGDNQKVVLAGIRSHESSTYISSTRIQFDGEGNSWFDANYTPSLVMNHITATNNPTLTHSLVTPDGYLWLTGKTNTVAVTQESYIVATPLAGSAVGAAATDSLGFGVTHPLGLMQGTDDDVMLILARSSSGTHAIAGKVFNNPLNVSSYIEIGLTSGVGEFESDIRGAIAPGNRLLTAYRLSTATTDRRVARLLPYALNNNMVLQNDCGVVALRESIYQDSPTYSKNLLDSINIDGDIVLVFGNSNAYPSTVVNVLSDGERWDYKNTSSVNDRLLGYQNGLSNLYALAFDNETEEFVTLASLFGFFDDDDFGSEYIYGVLRADTGTGDLYPQFGLPSNVTNMILLPNATGGYTPAAAWNEFQNGLVLKTPDDQILLDENHDGDVHYMALGTDNSLWLVLTDSSEGAQHIRIQRYLLLTDPIDPMGLDLDLDLDFTLPLFDTNDSDDVPIGFALDDQNRALVYSTNYSGGDLAVRRILPEGGLDGSFASSGVFSLPQSFTNPMEINSGRRGAGLVVDEQNNIFFPFAYQEDFIDRYVLAKLLPSGVFDLDFGEDGTVDLAVTLDFEFSGNFSGVRLGESDKIQALWEEGTGYAMVQLNPDGSLDTSFGRQGYVRMGPSADEMARQLATDNDGRLYPLMQQNTAMPSSVFWGLNADGSKIQDFGNPTPTTMRDGGSVSMAYTLPGSLQPSGQGDLLLGLSYNGFGEFIAELFKYDLDILGEGEVNPQSLPFDPVEVPNVNDTFITAMSPLVNGRALVIGGYYASNEDGVFVTRIDPNGNMLTFPFGSESPASIAIASEWDDESDAVAALDDGLGNVFLLLNILDGWNDTHRWELRRLNSDNMTGEVMFERNDSLYDDTAIAIALDAQGRILVVEEREITVFDSVIQVTRLNTDGTVDSSWNFDQMSAGYPQRINTLQVVGNEVILGGLDDSSRPLVVRLNEFGNVTHRWHGSMLINSDYAEVVDLTLDPRGHLNVLLKAYKDTYWQTVITRMPAMY